MLCWSEWLALGFAERPRITHGCGDEKQNGIEMLSKPFRRAEADDVDRRRGGLIVALDYFQKGVRLRGHLGTTQT